VKLLKVDFEGLQKNLELKESALFTMQRSIDRCGMELNRIVAQHDTAVDDEVQLQIDDMRKTAQRMICELEAKIMGIEIQQAALTDQLWGEETGLAKVCGEAKRIRADLEGLTEDVRLLQSTRVEPKHLSQLRQEVHNCLGKAEDEMRTLRSNVGNVVNDTKEHLRTALETVATQHACFMEEVRGSYRAELMQAADLREEVGVSVAQMRRDSHEMDLRIQSYAGQTSQLLEEHKDVMDDSDKRRKRDRASLDLEIKGIQKRIGGIFDSHTLISKGIEHLGGIVGTLVEAERMQCAFNLQDTMDREHMYLLGLREEAAPKEPPPHGVEQSPGSGRTKQHVIGSPRRAAKKAQIVHVDQRCLSCSGQSPTVLSAFKMACLQYKPSPVKFQDVEHTRFDILNKMSQVLARAHNMYSFGPEGQEEASTGNSKGKALGDYMPIGAGASQVESRGTSRLPNLNTNNVPSTPRISAKTGKGDMIE